MTEFWITAAFMTVIALGFLAWPIWRARERSGHWSPVTLTAAVLVMPIAVLLYRNITTWNGASVAMDAATDEQLAIVEQLAARMQQQPDDIEGWMLLGRSYLTLQHFPEARQAFLQAWQRMPTPTNELKLGLGIAMIHSDRSSIGSDGGQLIEEVLTAEPQNMQALWYGGMVAIERGRNDLARDRWSRLLALQPPPEIAGYLQEQLAALGGGIAPFASSSGAAPAAASGQGGPAADAGSGPVIPIKLTLGDGVATDGLGPSAALFIFARAQAGGPPLAVIRQPASAVPGEFTLSNANTMIQGNSIENYDEITIVARLSKSGQPIESSGDIFASTVYNVKAGGAVELTLDQVVP
jgi:cytochrome c-type biogenesis protein CcmH